VKPQVALIHSGGANIASLQFALSRLGYEGVPTADIPFIETAAHVILPGVGAASAAMVRLHDRGLDRIIHTLRQPVLGICLGLQLMFDRSDENDTRCLGILEGRARLIEPAPGRPVPHMGWNQVHRTGKSSDLLDGIDEGAYFYFVHSYAVDAGAATIASTCYGKTFTAIAERDNFVATQFHPEKSGPQGQRLLRNFLARN